MTKKTGLSHAEKLIREIDPNVLGQHAQDLALVWDEVVHQIVLSMLDDPNGIHQHSLHINVRGEMVLYLAQLTLEITVKVVNDRVASREIYKIDPRSERAECFSLEGIAKIRTTAQIYREHVWNKRLEVRWLPKSKRAIENEIRPRKQKSLVAKPVLTQHYISRWLIRDHWAQRDKAIRWRKCAQGWRRGTISFGSWGHSRRLWSDKLEAYFGLLEGDAKRPIDMLLRVEPLNPLQQNSFVAFIVIHILRNPSYLEKLQIATQSEVDAWAASSGMSDCEAASKAFEGVFSNDEIYRLYAAPLLESRWAIVSAIGPSFVMPDSFCVMGMTGAGLRFIVPISPFKCFVTLPLTEIEKCIVPLQCVADEKLAAEIGAQLARSAKNGFLSHPEFCHAPPEPALSFEDVLMSIQKTILNKDGAEHVPLDKTQTSHSRKQT